MVYKNNHIKSKKRQYKKFVFYVLLIIYFTGMCAGCTFAFKNGNNMDFVSKVTFTANSDLFNKSAILSQSVRFLIRDLICVAIIFVLKNAGILKGLCRCVPFIVAVQNSCIYTILIYKNKINIFNIIFFYLVKDSAVVFLIMIYCFISVMDIISDKNDIKMDIKKAGIYISGILFIYVIDYAVKTLIYPF